MENQSQSLDSTTLLWVIIASSCDLLLVHLLACLLFAASIVADASDLVYFIFKPMLFAEVGILITLFLGWLRRTSRSAVRVTVFVAAAFLVLVTAWTGAVGGALDLERVMMLAASILAGGVVVGVGYAVRKRWKAPSFLFFLTHSAVVIIGFASLEERVVVVENRLGLVSFRPSISMTMDYSHATNKDNYPVCEFQYNSLGYRDIEPYRASDADNRVLVVGDSFVWGDGIPTNEQTLGSLLRESLNERAPGGYVVSSAGFPGNGIYGYWRAVEKLQPMLSANIVIIGYLGEKDHDPYDAQRIAEGLPEHLLVRRFLVNTRAVRHAHQVSVSNLATLWKTPAARHIVNNVLEKLAERGRRNEHRTILLRYIADHELPEGIEAFDLPSKWAAYPIHRASLWYAKDSHPRPKLNRLLASALADYILDGVLPEPTKTPAQPDEDSQGRTSPREGTRPPRREVGSRVLPPDAGRIVSAALQDDSAVVSMERASIDRDRVEASACEGEDCFSFVLTDPRRGCRGGKATVHWCLRVTEGSPSERAIESLTKGLSASEDPWVEPQHENQQAQMHDDPPMSPVGQSVVLLIAILLGIGAVWVIRR